MTAVWEVPPDVLLVGIGGVQCCLDGDDQHFGRTGRDLVGECLSVLVVDAVECDRDDQWEVRVREVSLGDRIDHLPVSHPETQVQGSNNARLTGVVRPYENEMISDVDFPIGQAAVVGPCDLPNLHESLDER